MAKKQEFSKFKLTYKDQLLGYFNTPYDIDAHQALVMLENAMSNLKIEEAVSNTKPSILEELGIETSTKKSEDF